MDPSTETPGSYAAMRSSMSDLKAVSRTTRPPKLWPNALVDAVAVAIASTLAFLIDAVVVALRPAQTSAATIHEMHGEPRFQAISEPAICLSRAECTPDHD